MATGGVVLITVLPEMMSRFQQNSAAAQSYMFAATLVDSKLAGRYSGLTSANGDFSQIIPRMSGQSVYTWRTAVVEEMPGLGKNVTLEISWGTGAEKSDTYVFFVADLNDD